MSISASAVIGIIALVASIASSSAAAGSAKKAGDEEEALAKQQAKEEAERRDKVRQQQKRTQDIGGLTRLMEKRRGAEQTARQVPGAKPIVRGKLEAPAAPAPTVPAPATPTPAKTGVSPSTLDTIGSGIQAGAQVASGITGAVAASQAAKARQEEADRISKLEEEEFQKNLAAKKRDVNMQGLNLQDQSAMGAGASARQKTFATDFMSVLRNIKGQPRRAA